MVPTLSELRSVLSGRELTQSSVDSAYGPRTFDHLRRTYFPRWNPYTVHAGPAATRAYRRVVVEDAFEANLVRAVAPPDVVLRIDVKPAVPRGIVKVT
jgi:hypothetical protein